MEDRCCIANVEACRTCTRASSGTEVVTASTVQRTAQAVAARAVSRAGPSRAAHPPPQTNSTTSMTMPSAISRPIDGVTQPGSAPMQGGEPVIGSVRTLDQRTGQDRGPHCRHAQQPGHAAGPHCNPAGRAWFRQHGGECGRNAVAARDQARHQPGPGPAEHRSGRGGRQHVSGRSPGPRAAVGEPAGRGQRQGERIGERGQCRRRDPLRRDEQQQRGERAGQRKACDRHGRTQGGQ